VWNSRAVPGGHHRRSDSGSSAQSLQSRTDEDFASPDADHGRDYLTRASRDVRRHFTKSDPGLYQLSLYVLFSWCMMKGALVYSVKCMLSDD